MLPNSAAPTGLPDSRTGVIAAVLAPRVDDLSSLACGVRLAGPDALDGEMAEAARLWWNEARAVFGRCDAAGGQQAVGEGALRGVSGVRGQRAGYAPVRGLWSEATSAVSVSEM